MADSIGKRVGARIRELRLKAGLSQAKLAERLGAGVAVETVSRFERGAQVPTFEWVERISVALGTDVDGFLGAFSAEPADRARRAELEQIAELLAPLSALHLRYVHALLHAHLSGVEAVAASSTKAILAEPDTPR